MGPVPKLLGEGQINNKFMTVGSEQSQCTVAHQNIFVVAMALQLPTIRSKLVSYKLSDVQRIWTEGRLWHSSTRVEIFDDVPVVDLWIRTDASCHQLPQYDAVRPL